MWFTVDREVISTARVLGKNGHKDVEKLGLSK